MTEPGYSGCGMRCDLCLIYRPNVLREDRRKEICAVWRKIMRACDCKRHMDEFRQKTHKEV